MLQVNPVVGVQALQLNIEWYVQGVTDYPRIKLLARAQVVRKALSSFQYGHHTVYRNMSASSG